MTIGEGNWTLADGAEKKKQHTLVVDLGELKAPWKAWCASHDMTPSEAVRRVLQEAMKAAPGGEGASPMRQAHAVRNGNRKRFEISLSVSEYQDVADMAKREGMTVARLFRSVVRRLTTGQAQFSLAELEALTISNRAMIALGRNVNQIARHMNERPDKDELTLAQLDLITREIEDHRRHVRSLLDANADRWRR